MTVLVLPLTDPSGCREITTLLQQFELEVTLMSKTQIKSSPHKIYKSQMMEVSPCLFQVSLSPVTVSFKFLYQISPRTSFRRFTAGSATKCFRAHWRLVLTTPTCRCPGGDRGVSTDRERMAASPSVSQEPDRDKDRGAQWCLDRSALQPGLITFPHSPPVHSYNARKITISPGSISTDRSATSSSSSDKGLWLADRPENRFQLRGEEEVQGERQLKGLHLACGVAQHAQITSHTKVRKKNHLTDSTRHVPEAPHTQSRHTAQLASGPTHRASSS